MENIILFSISFIAFITYVLYVTIKYGVLPSISESYYYTNNKLIFALFAWFTAIPLMIVASTPLMFFSGAALGFVGASPAFHKNDRSLEDEVHMVSGILIILFGLLSMIIDFNIVYPTIVVIFLIISFILFNIKNKIYWIEILFFFYIMFIIYMERIIN